jgi:amidohydrolase
VENKALTDASGASEQLVHWRRYLHAHPELSGFEERTAAYVSKQLQDLGYHVERQVGGTHGLTATLNAGSGGAVALRADMDALPIQEESGVAFASETPGVMHACGHDAHTAMLLGAAKVLQARKKELRRPVKLIFQPAEEKYPGGAAPMIAGGALNGVERIFGIHISSMIPTGQLGTRAGAFMAAVNELDITVHGKGGHAAMPEQCIDPVVIAAQIIMALQTTVSRAIAMTDPAVVSVTMLEAGTANNVIPENVRMCGTVRTYEESVRKRVCERVREIAEGIARTGGGSATVALNPGYPALINDANEVEKAMAAARAIGFEDKNVLMLPAQGGGEDFAYYCQHVPGTFVFLGARDEATGCCYPHHHPKFNIDERALPLGAALLAQVALDA